MENTTKTSQLILIKSVSEYFDADLQPTEFIELKYIMVKDPRRSDIQMLLMEERNPFIYHAGAALSYMHDNRLNEIMINGGGKVMINPKEKRMVFYDRSYAFGSASSDEVKAFAKALWPNFEIIDRSSSDRKEMAVDGKVWTRDKVTYEANNP
ncbi:MAG TPA: hypothetical protein VL576_02235 [Candidatus Paceibacterota bacterium]|jgi:hypothetical protein|nr:hypothetical protein [Candidatus Paceibacterota bacterium]